MLGAVGELEHGTIVENVKLGMKQRAREGKWNGGVVLGYQTVDDGLQIGLYASGKGYKATANTLNHEGHKTKKGNPFAINAIRDILTNPVYVGKIRYNVRENWNEKRRKGKNSNPIVVDGQHPPIITDERWEQVQKLIESKGANRSGRTTTTSSLQAC